MSWPSSVFHCGRRYGELLLHAGKHNQNFFTALFGRFRIAGASVALMCLLVFHAVLVSTTVSHMHAILFLLA